MKRKENKGALWVRNPVKRATKSGNAKPPFRRKKPLHNLPVDGLDKSYLILWKAHRRRRIRGHFTLADFPEHWLFTGTLALSGRIMHAKWKIQQLTSPGQRHLEE